MSSPMTSRQRVTTVLAGGIPDRVPINYHANAAIDGRLKAHYHLAADDTEGLRQALGVDIVGHGAGVYQGKPLHTSDDPVIQVDPIWGYRRRWVGHESGGYWDYCQWPLTEANLDEVEAFPLPNPDDFEYDSIRDTRKKFKDYAMCIGGAGVACVINTAGFYRTMEQVFVDLITEDPAGMRLIDRFLDIQYEQMKRLIAAAEPGDIDFMWMGEDLGTQAGPIINPKTYRKIIRPRHQRFVDLAKAHDIPVMVHTCGSSSWAYEDFIDMGITAVDTLQPEATNMDPAYLKKTFGGRLAFHGCISTAGAVAYGTVDDVVKNCRETLDIMMPGGGYMFAPTHSLQDNSPTENVVAMYDTAKEYGRYR